MDEATLAAIRDRDAGWSPRCVRCGEPKGGYHAMPLEECGRVKAGGECLDPDAHHPYIPATDARSYMPGDQEAWDRRALITELDRLRGECEGCEGDGR